MNEINNEDKKTTPTIAGLAGIAVELGSRVAIDLGYRYMYMIDMKIGDYEFDPRAHQLRGGLRFHF
jgi:opacity protein-like surface antigen